MKTGAVIVAAGLSSRMGEFKPMLKLGSHSIIQRIVISFRQAEVSPIVVITGFRGDELEEHLKDQDLIFLRNKEYETTQMFDSAKIGLSYIMDRCDRTFFTPVDIPLFTANTVRELMKTNAKIAKPVCDGKRGHPILIDCGILPEILAVGAVQGLKSALRSQPEQMEFVEVEDEGILYDANTPLEYEKLLNYYNSDNKMVVDKEE